MKTLLLTFSVCALFLTGFLVVGTQHASAAAWWCGVMADPQFPNGALWDGNCTAGQLYVPGALSGVGNAGTSSATLKANFIAYINNKATNGYEFQKVGAAFIKDHLDGNTGTWVARLNEPAVTLKVETYNSCFPGVIWPNTAYDPVSNSVVNDNGVGSCVSATALVIRSAGVVKFAIKYDCGNPLGDLAALPVPIAWTLTSASSVSPVTAQRGATITFKHTVHNAGPSTATYNWTIQQSDAGGAWFNVATALVATAAGANNPNALVKTMVIPAGAVNGSKYCQHIVYNFATGPGTANGVSGTQCVVVFVQPSFDGVKIDNSGLPGGSDVGYGGNCAPVVGACSGGYATYPFSDDAVKVSGGVLSSGANPFSTASFPSGPYTVSITDAGSASPDSGWQLAGYSICNGPACTSKVLTTSGNITPIGGGTSFSFAYTFSNGGNYHMRWIYEPTITALCVNPTITPASPEDGEAFQLAAFMGTNIQATSPRDALGVKITNNATGAVVYPLTNQAYTSMVNMITATPFTPLPGGLPFGAYTVTTVLTGSNVVGSPVSCTGPLNIVRKPYFKVYGGDIFAGGSFKSPVTGVCALPTVGQGSLTGQYLAGASPGWGGGAGTELAAIAILKISGVASASMRPSFPTEPNDLTFANTLAPPAMPPSYMGGNYGAGQGYCAPDYFNDEQFVGLSPTAVNAIDVTGGSLAPGGQTLVKPASGTLRLSAGALVPRGFRHTIFVDGNVQITGDINYTDAAAAVDNPLDVPYLTIIAKGNIYIDPGVSVLSGLYIAQPISNPISTPPTTGYIFTCRDNSGGSPLPIAATFATSCDSKLAVYGAFIAQRVILQRTIGTVRNNHAFSGQVEHGDSPNLAEEFKATPELYIGSPVFKAKTNPYDSIKELPPVL